MIKFNVDNYTGPLLTSGRVNKVLVATEPRCNNKLRKAAISEAIHKGTAVLGNTVITKVSAK